MQNLLTRVNNKDTVCIIKYLPVKGAVFTAKQGTMIKKISLVADVKFI